MLNALFIVVAVVWLLVSLRALIAVISLRPLPVSHPPSDSRVTVVIAARDEAARLATTVCNLLAQTDVELSLVVVNDRSTDTTGEILDRLAMGEPQLRVVHVSELPAGWLGKCHALHVGAQQASGDWLLFVDGDIWMQPTVVMRALAEAERAGIDHLCLLPGLIDPEQGNVLDQASLLTFLLAFVCAIDDANRDLPWRSLGVGAFNLVRADAYKAIGGHERLRMEVVDDMKLGLLLRRAGKRTRALLTTTEVQCDWPHSIVGLIKAVEKNAFAGAMFSVPAVVAITVAMLTMWTVPWIGLALLTPPGIAAFCAYLSLLLPTWVLLGHHLGGRFTPGALLPIVCAPVTIALLWNSMLITLRQGGVRWRDTFYSLDELRRGLAK